MTPRRRRSSRPALSTLCAAERVLCAPAGRVTATGNQAFVNATGRSGTFCRSSGAAEAAFHGPGGKLSAPAHRAVLATPEGCHLGMTR
jgi:hypothetical protein